MKKFLICFFIATLFFRGVLAAPLLDWPKGPAQPPKGWLPRGVIQDIREKVIFEYFLNQEQNPAVRLQLSIVVDDLKKRIARHIEIYGWKIISQKTSNMKKEFHEFVDYSPSLTTKDIPGLINRPKILKGSGAQIRRGSLLDYFEEKGGLGKVGEKGK